MFTSIVLAIIAIIVIALFIVFFSVGLILFLGIAFVALLVGAIAFVVMGGTSFLDIGRGDDVVQSFHACLLAEAADDCRSKWTTWGDTEKGFVESLAQQAKNDLGKRDEESASNRNVESHSNNGVSEIKMEMVTDFEKKKEVKERYLIVGEGDDLKIKEVAWEY